MSYEHLTQFAEFRENKLTIKDMTNNQIAVLIRDDETRENWWGRCVIRKGDDFLIVSPHTLEPLIFISELHLWKDVPIRIVGELKDDNQKG